jgi:two-component system, OmpR family, KDP operon response regulator KdpE
MSRSTRSGARTVLVLDDDPAVRTLLRRSLTAAGYLVEEGAPDETSIQRAIGQNIDLVLFDLDAPAGRGPDAVREARSLSQMPIVTLSVRDDEDTAVRALKSGADDYVRKPFGTREVVARVTNALRRRAIQHRRLEVIVTGELEINLLERRVRSAGTEVRLTPKPFEVLSILAEKAGQVVSYQTILRAVWGHGSVNRVEYIRAVIRELRAKLEPDPERPRYILTERGVGYRLVHRRPGATAPSIS